MHSTIDNRGSEVPYDSTDQCTYRGSTFGKLLTIIILVYTSVGFSVGFKMASEHLTESVIAISRQLTRIGAVKEIKHYGYT